jgi:hypothetical protein
MHNLTDPGLRTLRRTLRSIAVREFGIRDYVSPRRAMRTNQISHSTFEVEKKKVINGSDYVFQNTIFS